MVEVIKRIVIFYLFARWKIMTFIGGVLIDIRWWTYWKWRPVSEYNAHVLGIARRVLCNADHLTEAERTEMMDVVLDLLSKDNAHAHHIDY